MQKLWPADDRLRRNPHWRFTVIPSTNAVNWYRVISGYNYFSLFDSSQMFRTPLNMHATWSQSDTLWRLRLFWTSDDSDIATCTWQHTTLPTDRYQCPLGFRTHKPSKTLPADPSRRRHGQCYCPSYNLCAADNRYIAWCLVQCILPGLR